jgi:gliding motility-associated-like protein
VFQKLSLSLKNYENFDANKFLEPTSIIIVDDLPLSYVVSGRKYIEIKNVSFRHLFTFINRLILWHLLLNKTKNLIVNNSFCKIHLFSTRHYIIPNVFTPNKDGTNDLLHMDIQNVASLEMEIFNRWGNLVGVVNSIDPEEGWDGRHVNTGVPVTESVYFA